MLYITTKITISKYINHFTKSLKNWKHIKVSFKTSSMRLDFSWKLEYLKRLHLKSNIRNANAPFIAFIGSIIMISSRACSQSKSDDLATTLWEILTDVFSAESFTCCPWEMFVFLFWGTVGRFIYRGWKLHWMLSNSATRKPLSFALPLPTLHNAQINFFPKTLTSSWKSVGVAILTRLGMGCEWNCIHGRYGTKRNLQMLTMSKS